MSFSFQQSLANFYPTFETHLKYHSLNEVFLEYPRVYFRFCVPYSSLYIPLNAFYVIDFYDYLLKQTKGPLKEGTIFIQAFLWYLQCTRHSGSWKAEGRLCSDGRNIMCLGKMVKSRDSRIRFAEYEFRLHYLTPLLTLFNSTLVVLTLSKLFNLSMVLWFLHL